jgi:hypothetical protein
VRKSQDGLSAQPAKHGRSLRLLSTRERRLINVLFIMEVLIVVCAVSIAATVAVVMYRSLPAE